MTPDAVIKALGGTNAVAALTYREPSSVSSWKARGHFPNDVELLRIISTELEKKGLSAPVSLWGSPRSKRSAA